MQEKEKEYNGIWKQLGCILSLVAILGIMAVFIVSFYLLLRNY
ncbi:hypothetical protein [Flagellimonas marinaquae]|nr:hypothetical protein [Allomuricauda aquimarina]